MSQFERLNEHIWIMHAEHETDRPILAAIAGSRRTLLMDAGNSPVHAARFQEYLTQQGVRPPDLLVLTHWHWDHTFGMSAWNLPSVAHAGTAAALGKLAGRDWSDASIRSLIPQGMASEATVSHIRKEYGEQRAITIIEPEVVFEGGLTIDLGGVTCEVEHVGGDHAEDSCFLFVREDKTLFLGDALGPAVYGGPRRYTSESFLRLLDRIHTFDADVFVESHGVPTARQPFLQDVADWGQLARLVAQHGTDKVQIAADMASYLRAAELPNDFAMAIEWFMAGRSS